MNDLLRAIFGEPPKDYSGRRMDEPPPNDYRDNFTRNTGDDMGDDDDGDDIRINPPGGFFDFSIFNDPTSIHRHFERLINEMNKAFGVFGFDDSASITFDDESRNMSPCSESQKTGNLRDLYLKPETDCCANQNQNNQISLKQNEPTVSSVVNPDGSVTISKGFSKFIYIQKVKRPDGSVEIIQKVRDHTGNEETTITQSNVNDPLLPPQDSQPTRDESSGLSLLRKFFPF